MTAAASDRRDLLAGWEKHVEWPLAGIASLFLVAYSIQVLGHPHRVVAVALNVVVIVSWVVFGIDYLVRLMLAPQRGRWFFRHLPDLAIVVLPVLRPLRLVSLVILVGTLQKAIGGAIRGKVIVYTVASAVLLIYVASLAVYESERSHADAVITSFGDAVWWAFVTVTTVGYGDFAPVSVTGRVVAVLLMIGGISLIGVVTATLASWIVQRVAEEDDANRAATAAEIQELRAEIRSLRVALTGPQAMDPEAMDAAAVDPDAMDPQAIDAAAMDARLSDAEPALDSSEPKEPAG
ncbi:potassium channel family protein [Gordonia sp. NB41Y]|uniref:potassium channel family protein n=1 Tax=Gordonia sp. NB41Y TaxID=875808 RepID=UPI0009E7D54B|nr:potassium channel family protein [Gordonia sp. NB41Y]WLP90129.1 potassium channel family protein [Gordonia sp. NB41Y]